MKNLFAAAAITTASCLSAPAMGAIIDLGFAIDESGSVDGTASTGELGLFRTGLANALDLIPSDGAVGNPNTYRVSVVTFSGSSSTLVAPTVITDASRADIQNTLLTAGRRSGGTNIPSSIFQLLAEMCPDTGSGFSCGADTTLFNIATDGQGGDPNATANPAAIAAGVEGISYEAVGGGLSPESIADFAFPGTPEVVTDLTKIPNPIETGFVISVATFDDFSNAIDAKIGQIVIETGGGGDDPDVIPLPAGLPLLLAGLGAFGGLSAVRRRKKA